MKDGTLKTLIDMIIADLLFLIKTDKIDRRPTAESVCSAFSKHVNGTLMTLINTIFTDFYF